MPDLEATRGDTNIFNIVVLERNQGINLTGAKLWFTAKHVREDPDNMAVILLDSAGNGIDIYDPLQGKAQITIPPTDTDGLTSDTILYYDVQLKDSDGIITTIAEGFLEILQDVTRAVA